MTMVWMLTQIRRRDRVTMSYSNCGWWDFIWWPHISLTHATNYNRSPTYCIICNNSNILLTAHCFFQFQLQQWSCIQRQDVANIWRPRPCWTTVRWTSTKWWTLTKYKAWIHWSVPLTTVTSPLQSFCWIAAPMPIAKCNDWWTAMHLACFRGNLEVVVLLLDRNALLDPMSSTGKTPFHIACRNGHLEVARFLRGKGIDMETHEYIQQWTPLHSTSIFQ